MTFNEQEVLHSPFFINVDLPKPKSLTDEIDSAAVVAETSPILDEPEYENLIGQDQTATAEIRITNLDDEIETEEKIVQEEHIYFAHVNLLLTDFVSSIKFSF